MTIAVIALTTACNTSDETTDPKPTEQAGSFIPTMGRNYVYSVESDGSSAEATRWISAEHDSVGIKVSNMRTEVSAFGQTITLNDNIFSLTGKTYTEIKLPDAWYQAVSMLDALPDIEVIKTEILGYPAYMTMQNAIKEGSQVDVIGSDQQEQIVTYTDHGKSGSMHQQLIMQPGTSTVETIDVPAGRFVCNKFTYETIKRITIKVGSDTESMDGFEAVSLWVAHGVGMVKMESADESLMLVPTATGGVKLVKSTSSSTTTLKKVN